MQKSAAFGGLLWLAAPRLATTLPAFGSIEHLFLLLPLVLAPLGLVLLFRLIGTDGVRAPPLVLVYLQPIAGASLLVSFGLPPGTLAAALAGSWWVGTLVALVSGLGRLRARFGAQPPAPNLVAALLFLPVGATWLVLSRLGAGPRSFTPLTVFLAALHFHFSGFTLQVLIAATGRGLEASWSLRRLLHRCVTWGAVAGLPLIAAGNIGAAPLVKFSGVACLVVSALGLSITAFSVGLRAAPVARFLSCVSAASIAGGMLLAGAYGVGELVGAPWLDIPRMVMTHGWLNAVGFTLCGLLGHLVGAEPRASR